MSTSLSAPMLASGSTFNLPANATVAGMSLQITAQAAGTGVASLNVQLANGTFSEGNAVNVLVSPAPVTYNIGSPVYQWGTTLTPVLINGAALGVLVQAELDTTHTTGVSATFSINALVATVYYTTSESSGTLLTQTYAFNIPLTSGISGFGATFMAFSSANTSVSMQLLQNGLPVGTPQVAQLTTTPSLYSLGGVNNLWGDAWTASNVNSPQFGVQIIANGAGVTSVGDLDLLVYLTPSLANFNWIGSYEQNNRTLTTLALDANGIMWQEAVNTNPGVLSIALTGIIPGSFANGATIDNSEFVMFSDLSIGTDRPRQLDADGNWYPVTQGGPGAPPVFQANTGSISGIIQLTNYSLTGDVITFTYTGTEPTAGGLYVLAIASVPYLNGQVVEVLSSGLGPTSFEADFTHANDAGGAITGTATPTFAYNIASITQFPQYVGNLNNEPNLAFLLSAGVGNSTTGNNVTVYYTYATGGPNGNSSTGDLNLINSFNSGNATYVQVAGAASVGGVNFDGIWLVTSVGIGKIPGDNNETLYYFTYTFTSTGKVNSGAIGSTYRITLATLTVATPVIGLTTGGSVTITGATPAGWNNTWTIVEAVNGGAYNITSTGYNYTTGVATYGWGFAGTTVSPPTVGGLITVIGATNNAVFNGTFVIATVVGATFTVNGIVAPTGILPGQTVETQAQATEFGTIFTFDPAVLFQGTTANVIYGNDTGTGEIAVIGSSIIPIGAGTRQAVCFFITKSGTWTQVSPPTTFTVASNANLLNYNNLPIGPPDVIARGIAITEAGANGVPGANFYVITEPVTVTVGAVVTTYTATIVQDNVTTSGSFSFTDAVLLDSTEIDIPGSNLFSLIELGSSAWCVPYSERMFYGLQLNKINNWASGGSLSFDGGYLPNPTGNILPLGWGVYPTVNEITLQTSPVTGQALYISNTTGAVQAVMGTIAQTAYQDPYNVAIIGANVDYSIRVTCDCPSGIQQGTLVISLVDLSGGVFGNTYGSFSIPFTSMTSVMTVFTGTLLTNPFSNSVSPNLQIRVQVLNMGIGADVLIDRIEVFPTKFPYLSAQVYGSYINFPEEVDASPQGGIIDTTTENPQPCMGGFVLRDSLYLLKTNSMYVTKDNANAEPGDWSLTEVSSRVGAIGIASYDTGDEWAALANRSGIYGFNGGIPMRLTEEIFQVWEAINWSAGNTIVLRNDIVNRRMLCAVPLPTGTSPAGVATTSVQWLPFAPYNPAPTTPNVILMLNYQALSSFEELVNSPEMHTTMFGTLAVQDMKRKWSIWNIATPYMAFIIRPNYNDQPLFVCNGIGSSKIYEFEDNQLSDDGVAIRSLYTTYGHVNAAKAVTMPIFGMHTKRYTVLQVNITGAGNAPVRLLPNDLNARYPYVIPGGITLVDPANDDFYRNINAKGQRQFLEFSTNAVGSYFTLCKSLLSGKADPWSPLNPVGGGNAGIM